MFYYIDTLQRLVGDARNCCDVMKNLISLLLFSFYENPNHRLSWYMFNTYMHIHTLVSVVCNLLLQLFAKSDILVHCIIHLVVIVTQALHAKQLLKINFCASWKCIKSQHTQMRARLLVVTNTVTCSNLTACWWNKKTMSRIFWRLIHIERKTSQ